MQSERHDLNWSCLFIFEDWRCHMNKQLNKNRLEIELLEISLDEFIKKNEHPPFRARMLQQMLGVFGSVFKTFSVMLDGMDRNSSEYQEWIELLKYADETYQKYMNEFINCN